MGIILWVEGAVCLSKGEVTASVAAFNGAGELAVHKATRPPLRRIMAIDQALRKQSWPNANTLSRSQEASARTIGRDIEFMRYQLRAPIAFGQTEGEPKWSRTALEDMGILCSIE
jgi:hypothetical protein